MSFFPSHLPSGRKFGWPYTANGVVYFRRSNAKLLVCQCDSFQSVFILFAVRPIIHHWAAAYMNRPLCILLLVVLVSIWALWLLVQLPWRSAVHVADFQLDELPLHPSAVTADAPSPSRLAVAVAKLFAARNGSLAQVAPSAPTVANSSSRQRPSHLPSPVPRPSSVSNWSEAFPGASRCGFNC